ncbi:MAG TPA: hypothetical protein VK806_12980 [Bacteroidia bacterium]|nr:hypothetical protein [Bacteroidia bacterium]
MRKLMHLVTALLCVISIDLSAQKIQWNPELKNVSEWDIHDIIGYDATGYYVTRYKNPHPHVVNATYAYLVTLEKYDFAGHRIFSKDIELGQGDDSYNFDGIFYMKNAMIAVMYAPDVKTAYAMKVNPDGSIDGNNKVLIGTIENKWKKEIMADNRFMFSSSSDKSTLLACYHKEKENKISISAIGDTPNILWSKEITTSFPEGKFAVLNAVISGNTAYLLVGGEKVKGKRTSTLIIYNHSTDAFKQVDVNLGSGNNIIDIQMAADNSGNALLAGLYTTEASDKDPAGTFLFTADNTGKVITNNPLPFTKDFLMKFMSEKKADKGEGISKLVLNKIIVMNDNSIIFAAEQGNHMKEDQWFQRQYYHSIANNMNNDITQRSQAGVMEAASAPLESWEYADAIVAKLKPDGSVTWIKDFPKKQQMTSHSVIVPYVCSYGISVTGNTVNVIYNDHKKNDGLNQDDIDKDRSVLKASYIDGGPSYIAVILESIDITTGDSKRITLFNAEKEKTKLTLYSTLFLQNDPNRIIVYRGNDDMDQFGQFIAQ